MSILLGRDEFYRTIVELRERLSRIEQALIELKPCECEQKEVKKVIPLKKK